MSKMRFFKNDVFKRLLCTCLCLATVFAAVELIAPKDAFEFDVKAATSQELQDKINEYERKEAEVQKKIDALQGDKDSAEAKAEALQEQVDIMESKVSLISQKISALESQIAEKQRLIDQKQAEIKEEKELLQKRLRAIYIAGASSDILVLLSAEDFGDFLEKTEVIKCITADTKKIMESLQDEIDIINKEKKEILKSKKEQDALKQKLVTEQTALDAKYKEAKGAYDSIAKTESELKAEAEELEKMMEEAQAEFNRLAQQAAQGGGNAPSVNIDPGAYGFAWPYGGPYYISSGYGWRTHPTLGYQKFHGGVDITGAGAYGRPIYAIADGVVILSQYYDSYGECIMLNNGSFNGTNITSLYAHCSSRVVYNGQSVKKGQVIGYVGSTGRSTGPHLHFEIRANGSQVNPLNYYSNY